VFSLGILTENEGQFDNDFWPRCGFVGGQLVAEVTSPIGGWVRGVGMLIAMADKACCGRTTRLQGGLWAGHVIERLRKIGFAMAGTYTHPVRFDFYEN
jgi:hypothetical protein